MSATESVPFEISRIGQIAKDTPGKPYKRGEWLGLAALSHSEEGW
jgi:hypothetical protein